MSFATQPYPKIIGDHPPQLHHHRGHDPLKWRVIAHLEVRSVRPERAKLPITSTGYRSHFHPPGTIEANGGDVVAQVIAWLDGEAHNPE